MLPSLPSVPPPMLLILLTPPMLLILPLLLLPGFGGSTSSSSSLPLSANNSELLKRRHDPRWRNLTDPGCACRCSCCCKRWCLCCGCCCRRRSDSLWRKELATPPPLLSGVAIGAKPAAPDKQRAAAAAVAAPITAPLGRRMTTSATKPRGASAREATIPRASRGRKKSLLIRKTRLSNSDDIS